MKLPALVLAGFMATCGAATVDDEAWLARVAYSAQPEALQEVKKIGREAYLEKQLSPPQTDDLPASVQAYVKGLETLQQPLADTLIEVRSARTSLKGLSEKERRKVRGSLTKKSQAFRKEAGERSILRATFSPWQLREQLTWFWFNHFNVFLAKGAVPYALADYENVLRADALGNFRDLLKASLMHPAMLVYLDNVRSTKNKPNENYARELLELHTLGVNGGYTQKDVQALARILTGVTVVFHKKTPKMSPKLRPLYIREGAFEFDPRLHDFSDKTFLGHTIKGSGWPEVEQVLDILATHPSTARHIARQLSTFLVADEPPKELVEGAADIFTKSKGDLKATVQFIIESDAFSAYAGKQFKSPLQYAISAVQIAGIKDPARVVRVVRQALTLAGAPLYGRLTPDGYDLQGGSWISTGQLANRLAVAENVTGLKRRGPPRDNAMDGRDMQRAGKQKVNADMSSDKSPTAVQKDLFLRLAGPKFMYR